MGRGREEPKFPISCHLWSDEAGHACQPVPFRFLVRGGREAGPEWSRDKLGELVGEQWAPPSPTSVHLWAAGQPPGELGSIWYRALGHSHHQEHAAWEGHAGLWAQQAGSAGRPQEGLWEWQSQ